MSMFNTYTETGRKEFVMEELRLCCELRVSYLTSGKIEEFIEKEYEENAKFWELEKTYGCFLSAIKKYLKEKYTGPDFALPLMEKIINEINKTSKKDHLIKHAVYILKETCITDIVFLFLHIIEKLINERRMRLL